LQNDITSAKLLANVKLLQKEKTAEGLVIQVPAEATDPDVTVIKLEVKGKVENAANKAKEKMKAGELD
jgi:alpha-L-fucosidase